jgi:hypothetical protein
MLDRSGATESPEKTGTIMSPVDDDSIPMASGGLIPDQTSKVAPFAAPYVSERAV